MQFLDTTDRNAADHARLHPAESFRISPLEDAIRAPALRFIDSWSIEDVIDRFGAAGINGQARLTAELTQRARPALVALDANGVVGLLDYVYTDGAIHIGIVVDSRFRRRSIGTSLIGALLQARDPAHPVAAECRFQNRPAVALLRTCRFRHVSDERCDMIWRHA